MDTIQTAPSREAGSQVFAEVPLLDTNVSVSDQNGDCTCFSCDGNPCNK